MLSSGKVPLCRVFMITFFATMFVVVPSSFPSAFGHGGHQPPAADFSGKKVSLFVSLEPIVIASATEPVYINARLFDENTNENFQHVTYPIFFEKGGQEIPILTEGGQFGGQGFFYDPEGNLRIKIVPKGTESAIARGESEPQFGGIWNRGGPVVVEGPIFTEPGLYNLFVEIHTVGTTRTQVAPALEYDVWVTPGREEMISVNQGGQTYDVKIRNYYGSIDASGYDPETKTIEFSMPFDWNSDLPSRIGMLHTEVFIPKQLSDFDKDSLQGQVNGIEVPVFAIPTRLSGEESAVVHFTVSQQNLQKIAGKVKSENRTPGAAVFSLSPPDPENEIHVAQTDSESENYKVSLTWPEQIFPEQPVTFGIKIADKGGKPIAAATYELLIIDQGGNQVSRAGGVTTPEGISSQDVSFASQGSFTVKVEKINASSESVQSSLTVIPEFPLGIAGIVAAVAVAAMIAARRTSIFVGKTY